MRSNWEKYTLFDIIDIIGGGTPKRSIFEYWNGNIPWLSVIDFNSDRKYVSYTKETITDLGLKKSSTKILDTTQLIISARGTVGALAQLTKPMAFNQSCYGINAKTEYTNNNFLYYLMKHKIYNLQKITHGAVFDTITRDTFKYIDIILPPLSTQKKISHILSTLDDKIELNHKMNQTLEEMAQALFKSWFVDFDPVYAKANSKETDEVLAHELGISVDILNLFPSSFVESELGLIPEGWEVKPLDEIAHYQNGLALQKFRPKDEKYFLPVLKIAQLKKGYADDNEKADPNIKKECIVNNGDIIFSWSGSLIVDIWCGGVVALNQHLFKVTSNSYSKWFYYYWTKYHLSSFQKIASDKAVTMGHIKRSHLTEALCIVPNQLIFDKLEKIINPLLEKIILNRLEINSLKSTRDTLLPKLLSGELDVSNIKMEQK